MSISARLSKISFKIRFAIANFICPEMDITVQFLEQQIEDMEVDRQVDYAEYYSTGFTAGLHSELRN